MSKPYSDSDGLTHEIWNQNFQALKTNYLKVMTENNAKLKQVNNYKFNESDDDFKMKSGKKPPVPKSEMKQRIHHAVNENEYEKFRRTFKDVDDGQSQLANYQIDTGIKVSITSANYYRPIH
jgi:23S rRNA maturation-related 3'-5' exoribonuclease YhaM